MPSSSSRSAHVPEPVRVNLYCVSCESQIGIFDNEWIRLTASYARSKEKGIHFATDVGNKTQTVPSGPAQRAAEGCVMSEVFCQKCHNTVGQYCRSAPSLDKEYLVGKHFYKLSRIFLKDSQTFHLVDPVFGYGDDLKQAQTSRSRRVSSERWSEAPLSKHGSRSKSSAATQSLLQNSTSSPDVFENGFGLKRLSSEFPATTPHDLVNSDSYSPVEIDMGRVQTSTSKGNFSRNSAAHVNSDASSRYQEIGPDGRPANAQIPLAQHVVRPSSQNRYMNNHSNGQLHNHATSVQPISQSEIDSHPSFAVSRISSIQPQRILHTPVSRHISVASGDLAIINPTNIPPSSGPELLPCNPENSLPPDETLAQIILRQPFDLDGTSDQTCKPKDDLNQRVSLQDARLNLHDSKIDKLNDKMEELRTEVQNLLNSLRSIRTAETLASGSPQTQSSSLQKFSKAEEFVHIAAPDGEEVQSLRAENEALKAKLESISVAMNFVQTPSASIPDDSCVSYDTQSSLGKRKRNRKYRPRKRSSLQNEIPASDDDMDISVLENAHSTSNKRLSRESSSAESDQVEKRSFPVSTVSEAVDASQAASAIQRESDGTNQDNALDDGNSAVNAGAGEGAELGRQPIEQAVIHEDSLFISMDMNDDHTEPFPNKPTKHDQPDNSKTSQDKDERLQQAYLTTDDASPMVLETSGNDCQNPELKEGIGRAEIPPAIEFSDDECGERFDSPPAEASDNIENEEMEPSRPNTANMEPEKADDITQNETETIERPNDNNTASKGMASVSGSPFMENISRAPKNNEPNDLENGRNHSRPGELDSSRGVKTKRHGRQRSISSFQSTLRVTRPVPYNPAPQAGTSIPVGQPPSGYPFFYYNAAPRRRAADRDIVYYIDPQRSMAPEPNPFQTRRRTLPPSDSQRPRPSMEKAILLTPDTFEEKFGQRKPKEPKVRLQTTEKILNLELEELGLAHFIGKDKNDPEYRQAVDEARARKREQNRIKMLAERGLNVGMSSSAGAGERTRPIPQPASQLNESAQAFGEIQCSLVPESGSGLVNGQFFQPSGLYNAETEPHSYAHCVPPVYPIRTPFTVTGDSMPARPTVANEAVQRSEAQTDAGTPEGTLNVIEQEHNETTGLISAVESLSMPLTQTEQHGFPTSSMAQSNSRPRGDSFATKADSLVQLDSERTASQKTKRPRMTRNSLKAAAPLVDEPEGESQMSELSSLLERERRRQSDSDAVRQHDNQEPPSKKDVRKSKRKSAPAVAMGRPAKRRSTRSSEQVQNHEGRNGIQIEHHRDETEQNDGDQGDELEVQAPTEKGSSESVQPEPEEQGEENDKRQNEESSISRRTRRSGHEVAAKIGTTVQQAEKPKQKRGRPSLRAGNKLETPKVSQEKAGNYSEKPTVTTRRRTRGRENVAGSGEKEVMQSTLHEATLEETDGGDEESNKENIPASSRTRKQKHQASVKGTDTEREEKIRQRDRLVREAMEMEELEMGV